MSASSSSLTARDLAAVTLVILLWGMNFVPTKLALQDFTPFQLGAARFLLAAFPLVLFLPRPQIPVKWLLLYGLTQGVGQFGFLFLALDSGMTTALASVLMQTQIFFTALMGATLLGEVISRPLKAGMVVASLGLVCFAVNALMASGTEDVGFIGLVLTLMAASMWASANILVRKIQSSGSQYRPLALLAWSSLISAVGFIILAALLDAPEVRWQWLQARPSSWVSLLYLGWAAGGVAFLLWTLLLTRHPASRVAPFSLGIPVVGLLAGVVILNEQVTTLQWIGSALVMSALVLVVLSALYSAHKLKRRYDAARYNVAGYEPSPRHSGADSQE